MKRVHLSVKIWLWIGVFMIFIQIILGGITRLTGSGLSITEWNLIMGILPPLNETQWLDAFHKYQQIPQFKVLNSHYTLSDFKGIFYWEYFHRLWGRSIGIVFLIPFFYFIFKKRITKQLWIYLSIAFVLGAAQGLIGWIMVKSGLSDRIWVSPLKLSLHLLGALVLLTWMVNVSLKSTWYDKLRAQSTTAKRIAASLAVLLFIQVGIGGLMAGSHAATFYPTWPDMNGMYLPPNLFAQSPAWLNFFSNITTIQFFHRGLAYLLFFLIIGFCIWVLKNFKENRVIARFTVGILVLLFLQILLGIFTLLGASGGSIPILLAVLHQSVGLLLFTSVFAVCIYFKKVDKEPFTLPEVKNRIANS